MKLIKIPRDYVFMYEVKILNRTIFERTLHAKPGKIISYYVESIRANKIYDKKDASSEVGPVI